MTQTKIKISSQKVEPGDTFIPIIGEVHDGHKFIPDAIKSGAIKVYHSKPLGNLAEDHPGTEFVQVDDTTKELGRIASEHLEDLRASGSLQVIAITGSVGKTTTKDLLGQVLSKFGPTVFPKNSFNNEIGLPLTILEAKETTEYLVLEIGANHVGEIQNLTKICIPDVAVLLKAGVAHAGEFGGADKILREKTQIFSQNPRVAIYGADDANSEAIYSDVASYMGSAGKIIHIHAENAKNLTSDADLHINFELEGVHFAPSVSGEHNVYNALAAIYATSSVTGPSGALISLEEIASAIKGVGPIAPHRMDVQHHGKITIIDDAYNANPDSMRAGLDALVEIANRQSEAQGVHVQSIAVLGDMLELGEDTEEAHKSVGKYAVEVAKVDKLVVTGNYAKYYIAGADSDKVVVLDDYYNALSMHTAPTENVVYLLKASYGGRLWEVRDRLI